MASSSSGAGATDMGGGFNSSTTYFPSGMKEGSALAVTKIAPKEANLGQEVTYRMEVTNVSDAPLQDVMIEDSISDNFELASAFPQPESADGNALSWKMASLAPGQTVTINVTGTTSGQGVIEHCATASYKPVVCAETRIVEPGIQIEKTLPAQVTVCDPIPMQIVVRNTGSSRLSGVRLADTLPAGLTTADGASSYNQEIGDLEPGQSRQFMVDLKASMVGEYSNTASASSAQGVSDEASANVTVVQPVLSLTCDTPEQRFEGRPITVCLTASNMSDIASFGTQVVLDLPAGVAFQSATQGGTLQGSSVVWDIGNLGAQDSRELCATVNTTSQGSMFFSSSARGDCADEVRTSCSTMVSGIPALLLEVIDVTDPVEVGNNETYVIAVTNQGSAPATQVEIGCTLEDTQSFVSGSGTTSVSASGSEISMGIVPSIAPKERATWEVIVRAEAAGDVRFSVEMDSAEMTRPVNETESTNQY